jgi:hypothetical protein
MAAFRWNIPARFNIGTDVADRPAAQGASLALIELDPAGRRAWGADRGR